MNPPASQVAHDPKALLRHPAVLLYGQKLEVLEATMMSLVALDFCSERSGCGRCHNCRSLAAGDHPDLLILRPESGRLLRADATQAAQHLCVKANGVPRTVVLCGQLAVQAANQLLKILEEPPSQAKIWLLSPDLSGVLPTVLSRMLRHRVGRKGPFQSDPAYAAMSERFLKEALAQPADKSLDLVEELVATPDFSLESFLNELEVQIGISYRGILAGTQPAGANLFALRRNLGDLRSLSARGVTLNKRGALESLIL